MTKMKAKAKTKSKTKNFLFYKKESERTKSEKLCRDIAFYGVTIFTAVMGFLLVDANASLLEAEADSASNHIVVAQHFN